MRLIGLSLIATKCKGRGLITTKADFGVIGSGRDLVLTIQKFKRKKEHSRPPQMTGIRGILQEVRSGEMRHREALYKLAAAQQVSHKWNACESLPLQIGCSRIRFRSNWIVETYMAAPPALKTCNCKEVAMAEQTSCKSRKTCRLWVFPR